MNILRDIFKSKLFCEEVTFLGHQLSSHGMSPSAGKVAAIRALPTPTDVGSLRRMLGFASFYRGYVPGYSNITKPLTDLTGKGVVWEWTEERDKAWNEMKDALCTPGNALRPANPDLPFRLHTDWSKKGISAVLGQIDPETGQEYLVSCLSRSCSKEESRYGSYNGEMLACCWGIRSNRQYLLGARHRFTVYTDHRALLWLLTSTNLEGQYARWQVSVSDYDFEITYKPGVLHDLADIPSRFPMATTEDLTGTREPVSAHRFFVEDHLLTVNALARVSYLIEHAEDDGCVAQSLLACCLSESPLPQWGVLCADRILVAVHRDALPVGPADPFPNVAAHRAHDSRPCNFETYCAWYSCACTCVL